MPPKRPSAAPSSKPPSKATVKPPSTKPPSKAAPANPPSTATAKPASRRGATKTATPAPAPPPETIVEDGDYPMGDDEKPNGHAEASTAAAAPPALKRGRIGELAGEEKKLRRRSSIGSVVKNDIPQPPVPSNPHKTVFGFGTGDMGQFGLGPDELDEIPRPRLQTWFEQEHAKGTLSRDGKPNTGGIEAIACGGMHSLAIDEGGRVHSWGINDNAALGRITSDVLDPLDNSKRIPNEDLETWPYIVESLEKEGFRAVQVAAGDSVSVAVSDQGEIRAWGSFRGNDGVLGFDGVPGHSTFQFHPMPLVNLQRAKVQIVSVSCGSDHVLALTTTGHVYTWGSGQQAQLGRRVMERRRLNGLEPERLGLRKIVLVSTGTFHSFAVNSEGEVWAWGLNTFHQTGIAASRGGNVDEVSLPTQVDALHPDQHDGARVIQIAGGDHHSVFLFDNGEVWACGRCDANQVGIAEDHPAFAGVLERREEMRKDKQDRVDVAQAKLDRANDEEGKEDAERELSAAQANLAAAVDEYIPEPVWVPFPPIPEEYEVVPDYPPYDEARDELNPIAHISAGTRHNLAVSRSRHVYSWGLGNQAQLGLGKQESAEVPSLVRSKWLRPYKALSASAGGQHCLLLAQGQGSKEGGVDGS